MVKIIVISSVSLVMGLASGWVFNLLIWYFRKGSLRWTWLLCKPMLLSKHENRELDQFYAE